jgi:hypothetical protein
MILCGRMINCFQELPIDMALIEGVDESVGIFYFSPIPTPILGLPM